LSQDKCWLILKLFS